MRVEVNGVRLFVDVDGVEWEPAGETMRRRPVVLLLHGGPGLDHSSFKGELGALRDVAQLVYLDHRGNGRSDRGDPADWNLPQWADDVRALCDVLGIEAPIVFGQSFGGFVAQAYAARHPDHPAGLVFSSTAGRFREERNLAVFERLAGADVRDAARAFYADPCNETLGPFVTRCMPHYNTRFRDPDGMARTEVHVDVLMHFFRQEYPQVDLLPGLAAVRCPTLVLGGEDDPTTPIEDQIDIAAALPAEHVTFHRFAGCGHGAYRDCPDEALPILRDFIRRVGATRA